MAKPKYHPSFVAFLSSYPDQWEAMANSNVRRLQSQMAHNPEWATQVNQRYPDPQQRMMALYAKAANNTDMQMQTLLHKEAIKFGVKDVSPGMLHEAYTEQHTNNSPVDDHMREIYHAHGEDADKVFATETMPKSVARDVSRVSPYMFRQPDPRAMPGPQVQMQPETITAPPPMQGAEPPGGAEGVSGGGVPGGGADVVAGNQTGGGTYAPGTQEL